MIQVTTGASPELVRQASAHVLFVEGSKPTAIDVQAVSSLLQDSRIRVEPLGPSFSIRSVAEAMFPYHATYYYLIDRDHASTADVEKLWKNFPDSSSNNLLVWRKKEIENYFLDPELLEKSTYFSVTRDKLEEKLTKVASRQLYRDAANCVIVELRDQQKKKWVETFKTTTGMETESQALKRLLEMPELKKRQAFVGSLVDEKKLKADFESVVVDLTGGGSKVEVGKGKWQNRLRGKDLLPTIINDCFKVIGINGKQVTGDKKIHAVITQLMQLKDVDLPSDFVELRALLKERVSKGP